MRFLSSASSSSTRVAFARLFAARELGLDALDLELLRRLRRWERLRGRRGRCVGFILRVEHGAAARALVRAARVADHVDEPHADGLLDLDLDEPRIHPTLRALLHERLATAHGAGLRIAMEEQPHGGQPIAPSWPSARD